MTEVEVLCEIDKGNRLWWKQCKKSKCKWLVTHDSESFCYVHSKRYRKLKRPFNIVITWFKYLFE